MKELFLSLTYSEGVIISIKYNSWECRLVLTWRCFARPVNFLFLATSPGPVASRRSINGGGRKGWSREDTVLEKIEEMNYRLPSLKVESSKS